MLGATDLFNRRLAKLNRERWEAEQRAVGALSLQQPVAEYVTKSKRKNKSSKADIAQPALPFAESGD